MRSLIYVASIILGVAGGIGVMALMLKAFRIPLDGPANERFMRTVMGLITYIMGFSVAFDIGFFGMAYARIWPGIPFSIREIVCRGLLWGVLMPIPLWLIRRSQTR